MTQATTNLVVSDVGRRYLQLHLTDDIGPVRLRNLVAHFGSIEAALSASIAELERVDQVGRRTAEAIFRSRTQDEHVEREVVRAAELGLQIVCLEDPDYPAILSRIHDPPICLYVRGTLEPNDGVAVAIVGTRRCSHYGREQAIRFGEALGSAGFTVVSGLARGVDTWAHRGALRGGGRTIAVLGNGLASIYPSEHESLADDISARGAVVSELPLDTAPDAKNFPRRNRIIVGLSLGVLVVEAGRRSGALITARLATEYNREVFAVPGQVDRPEVSAGVNGLIRDGQAKLVTSLDEILDELGAVGEAMRNERPASGARQGAASASVPPNLERLAQHERKVLEAVTDGAGEPDGIAEQAGIDPGRVMSTLTALELKGLVRRLPGDRFVRRGRE